MAKQYPRTPPINGRNLPPSRFNLQSPRKVQHDLLRISVHFILKNIKEKRFYAYTFIRTLTSYYRDYITNIFLISELFLNRCTSYRLAQYVQWIHVTFPCVICTIHVEKSSFFVIQYLINLHCRVRNYFLENLNLSEIAKVQDSYKQGRDQGYGCAGLG